MYLIGIDIGGTKCAATLGKTKRDGGVELLYRGPQHKTAEYTPRQMLECLLNDTMECIGRAGEVPAAIGISCGSPLDSQTGRILSPPNLSGWDNIPITDFFRSRTSIPSFLCNDANAGALAEWKMGAGRGCRHMVFLTFGTGLGAGLILNGRLYEGASDSAGEVGHVRLAEYGPVGYGKLGSFEGFCSGGGIAQIAQDYVRAELQRGGRPALCPETDGLATLTARDVGEAAARGDALARAILPECGKRLGSGLSVLMDILNPEVIVLGSIFVRSREAIWPSAQEMIEREALQSTRAACRVVPSELAESIGDVAALMVAKYYLEMGRNV